MGYRKNAIPVQAFFCWFKQTAKNLRYRDFPVYCHISKSAFKTVWNNLNSATENNTK